MKIFSGNLKVKFIAITLILFSNIFAVQSFYDLMERANELYKNQKYNQAILLYKKAESRGADPVATSFNIANSLYQQNKYPEAAAAYRKSVDYSNGKFSPALFNLASVYFRLKQFPECIAMYHRALKLEPENVSGWLFLGEAYNKVGDKVGALKAVEKAYSLDKSDISVIYQLSEANIALKDFESAVKIIREGYNLHSEEIDFLVYLGDVYRIQNLLEKSAAAYREALNLKTDDVQIMYKLADVLSENHQPFMAMDVLQNILQIDSSFSDAAIFLGNLAYDVKFFDRAEYAYELAAKQNNNEAIFGLKNLAYDAEANKNKTEAIRLLKLAQKYFPKDITLEGDILELTSEN